MGLMLDYDDGQTPLGAANQLKDSDNRSVYLKAVREADKGEYDLLVEFAWG